MSKMASSTRHLAVSICLLVAPLVVPLTAPADNPRVPPELKLLRTLPVEGVSPVEPSGLTQWQGKFYVVSDCHDDRVFHLRLEENRAVLETARKFSTPELPEKPRKLDFEGITHDSEGNFYLAAERPRRILKVTPDGPGSWLGESLDPAGVKAGLFKKKNTGLEAITRLDTDHFLLCAEREPRGLLEFAAGKVKRVIPYQDSPLPLPKGREYDFTGLYSEPGSGLVWTLQRNLQVISLLKLTPDGAEEQRFYSFAQSENSPALRYQDMRYGRAEGICVDADKIYILMDNNGDKLIADKEDSRPRLLIFERPDIAPEKS